MNNSIMGACRISVIQNEINRLQREIDRLYSTLWHQCWIDRIITKKRIRKLKRKCCELNKSLKMEVLKNSKKNVAKLRKHDDGKKKASCNWLQVKTR